MMLHIFCYSSSLPAQHKKLYSAIVIILSNIISGSKLGRFTSVHLDGCSDSRAECELVRNTTVGIEITFDLGIKN